MALLMEENWPKMMAWLLWWLEVVVVQLSNCLLVEGEEGLLSCWLLEVELQPLNCLLVVG
jgi:hypothetical protein